MALSNHIYRFEDKKEKMMRLKRNSKVEKHMSYIACSFLRRHKRIWIDGMVIQKMAITRPNHATGNKKKRGDAIRFKKTKQDKVLNAKCQNIVLSIKHWMTAAALFAIYYDHSHNSERV